MQMYAHECVYVFKYMYIPVYICTCRYVALLHGSRYMCMPTCTMKYPVICVVCCSTTEVGMQGCNTTSLKSACSHCSYTISLKLDTGRLAPCPWESEYKYAHARLTTSCFYSNTHLLLLYPFHAGLEPVLLYVHTLGSLEPAAHALHT